jgi:2-polyprenyl-3-methyl-5-hydroxy-6-metoxy-1,4-benzoquinol methylase
VLITDEYRNLNHQLHQRKPAWGLINQTDLKFVEQLATRYGVNSILDYGCGKGRLGKVLHGGGKVRSYDPGVPEFSAPPEPADMVVCTAVLEHVEPECLQEVLDDLQRLAERLAYLKITTVKSSYNLENGRNSHLIVEPAEWWLPLLMSRWNIRTLDVGDRNFIFVGTKR